MDCVLPMVVVVLVGAIALAGVVAWVDAFRMLRKTKRIANAAIKGQDAFWRDVTEQVASLSAARVARGQDGEPLTK